MSDEALGMSESVEERASLGKSFQFLPWYRSKRHLAPLACFFAVFIMFITRFALSQAIIHISKLYSWNELQSAMVTYSFYLGYLATQVIGGYLSHRMGSKPVVAVGLLLSCVATCLFPFAAPIFSLVVVLRIITGLGQGVLYPAMTDLISHWVLPAEKSFIFNFSWSGGQAGTIFALGSYPYIADWTDSWKWPFYIYALFGVAWYLFWHFFIYSSPESHPKLGLLERSLLVQEKQLSCSSSSLSQAASSQKPPVPWMLLFKSPAIHALMCIYFSYCWTFYLLLSYLPSYLTYMLGYQNASQGLLAMTPYIGLWITLITSGYASDFLASHGIPLLRVRKLMVITGFVPSAVLLLMVSFYQGSDHDLFILICLFLIISLSGFAMAGFSPNPMDLSPTYAGIILSLGNIVGGSAGIFSLLFTGFMLHWGECGKAYPSSQQCQMAWACLFRVAGCVYCLGTIAWVAFVRVKPLNLSCQVAPSP